MAMRSVEFVGKAEAIKSHELSVKSLMEKLGSILSNLKAKRSTLQSEISSLYSELSAARCDVDEEGEPNYGVIASIENSIYYRNVELSSAEDEISNTSSELQNAMKEYEEVEEEKRQTLFEIQERARITSQNASNASGMYGEYASVGASLNQSFQAKFDSLAQAAAILDGTVSEACTQTGNGGGGSGRTGCGRVNIAIGAAAIVSSGMITSSSPKRSSLGSRQISGVNSIGGKLQYSKSGNTIGKGSQLSTAQMSRCTGNTALIGHISENKRFKSKQISHSEGDSKERELNEKKQTYVKLKNTFKESLVCKPIDQRASILGLETPGVVINDKYMGKIYERIGLSEKSSYSTLNYVLKQGKIKIKSANSEEEYYDPDEKGMYLNIPGDENDIEGSGTGLFHELGHAIDHVLGENQYLSNNEEFHNCLIRDCNRVIRKCNSDPIWRSKFFDLIKKSSDAYSVSDILEGITDGKITGGAGHEKDYWKNDKFIVCNEAFAHFFEASMGASSSRCKYIKSVFPDAYSKYLEMIRPFTVKERDELERER